MPRTAKYSPEQITSIYEQNVSRSFKEATRRKLTRRSLSLITNINNSIRDNIRTILREGVAEGKSVSAIASSLMTTGLDKGIFASARKRAYLIAKTELHRARQKGAIDIYKANKINRVRWVAISDGRVCERCLGRNNRTYLIRELTEEDFPPIHPRCRCRLLPDNFQVSIKVKQTAAGKVMETKVYPSPQNYKYIIKVKKSLEDLDKGFFSKFTHKYLSKKGTQGHFFDYKYPEFKRPGKPGKPEKPKKPLPSVYGKVYNMSLDLQLKNSNKTAIFEKEFNHEDFSLNGISFKSVPTPDFKTIVDKPVDPPFDVGEVPNLPFHHQSSGVIIEEPDGRVWVVEPSHHFGGYKQTFPKGTVEKGYTTQQTALKEAFEESGLHVEITGFLGDYLKTTSVTRYYLAKRVGGDPAKASWETARVRLAPFSELPKLLNRMVDKRILLDYLKSKMISKGLDVGEVKRKIKDYFDNVTKGQLSKDLEECGLEKGKRVFVPASGKRKAYTRFDPRNKKEILYHGTYGKFERFLPPDEVPEESQTYGQHEIGIYTSESEEFARTFGDRVVKVAKPKKTLDLSGAKTFDDFVNLLPIDKEKEAWELKRMKIDSAWGDEEIDMQYKLIEDLDKKFGIANKLKELGYDSLKFKEEHSGKKANTIVIFNAEDVKIVKSLAVDEDELKREIKKVDTSPTEAEKKSGIYQKGHINVGGLEVSIENPKGSYRSGVSKDGKEWKQQLHSHYGYIKGTVGKDKDHLDVFLGDDLDSEKVFVINQIDPKTKEFDEHKIMLGFSDKEDAEKGYLANYDKDWKGLDSIVEKTFDEFKDWATSGQTTKELEKGKKIFVPASARRKAYYRYDPRIKSEEGIKTVGLGISAKFAKEKYIDLRGQKVTSAQDVAELAQIYRNPKYETFRYIYVKKGIVVGHEGRSCHIPGFTKSLNSKIIAKDLFEVRRRIARLGADEVWVLHNHPSANPTPSPDDLRNAEWLFKKIPELKGSIVIDSGKYSVIDAEHGKFGQFDYGTYDIKTDEKIHQHLIENPLLGTIVKNKDDVARIASALKSPVGFTTVLYRTQTAEVRAIQEIPTKMLNHYEASMNYFRGRMREFGSHGVLIADSKDSKLEGQGYQNVLKMVSDGDILDDVKFDDNTGRALESVREGMQPEHDKRGTWMGLPIKTYVTKSIIELEKSKQVQVKPYQRKGKYVIGYHRLDPRNKLGDPFIVEHMLPTLEAKSVGEKLSKEEALEIWNEYKRMYASPRPENLKDFEKWAFRMQTLREIVEGYLGSEEALTGEEIDERLKIGEPSSGIPEKIEKQLNPERADIRLALEVIGNIADQGGRAMIVGGFVRDALLGKSSKDIDIEVYDLSPDKLKSILEKLGEVAQVGKSFGVFIFKNRELSESIDVSLPRRESKTGKGHKGFMVEPDASMTPHEAAKRRDLTINSMGYDPIKKEFIDPYGGLDDLKKKILRAVDKETFGDDPLRVLRVMRFAGNLGFTVDPELVAICRGLSDSLEELPKERIYGEMEKLLLKSKKPSLGLQTIPLLGIKLFPEITDMLGEEQDSSWHPEGDVWTHTLMSIDDAAKKKEQFSDSKDRMIYMLSVLLHDIGKTSQTRGLNEKGRITHRKHSEVGAQMATEFMKKRLTDEDIILSKVENLIRYHMVPTEYHKAKIADSAIRKLAKKLDIPMLVAVSSADKQGRGKTLRNKLTAERWLMKRYHTLGLDKPEALKPIVMGRHLLELGIQPGPSMGKILSDLYESQLSGRFDTVESGIEFARKAGLIEPIQKGFFIDGVRAMAQMTELRKSKSEGKWIPMKDNGKVRWFKSFEGSLWRKTNGTPELGSTVLIKGKLSKITALGKDGATARDSTGNKWNVLYKDIELMKSL